MIYDSCNFATENFRIQSRSTKNYNMPNHHFHDSYELYYMNSGTRLYFINDKTYQVPQGSLVHIDRHLLHKTIDTGQEHSRILMSFHRNFLNFEGCDEFLDSVFKKHPITSFNVSAQHRVEELLNRMIYEVNAMNPHYMVSIRAYLIELLLLTSRYIQLEGEQPLCHSKTEEKVQEILSYLQKNYPAPITLDLLSEKFFMSRYYISRLFKKETGFTIIEYLHSIRVLQAQKLLRETNTKIIHIAELTGFSNVSNFGKVFRSITGQTPMEYRKKSKLQ
ncbi:MAG: helix-turn-helix domain-containing protein [Vallitaleaceae bacterium]|nr:helix-turn-helix domain-containing protein [Vallitaleaceae bacterium]